LEFHDAQLLVGGAENHSHFSRANSTVYSNLLLNKTISSEAYLGS
jgi:hypothetical protein